MMIVMSYNAYLVIAWVLGRVLGYWFFSVIAPFANPAGKVTHADCH